MKAKTKYKHIWFDLDNTLWDFEANCRESLNEILISLCSNGNKIDQNAFFDSFYLHNEKLWELYRKSLTTKKEMRSTRFNMALQDFGINDPKLALQMGEMYLKICPAKTHLFKDTHEVLSSLKEKYTLHILTNGFNETQETKMQSCNLWQYFSSMVTSESVRYKKPQPGIFAYALSSVNAKKTESLMIGDDLTNDILGAKNFGIDQLYFNFRKEKHNECPTYEIYELKEILGLLI